MAPKLGNRRLAEEPALLALSRDRARSSGALPKANPKPELRSLWRPMDDRQRRARDTLENARKIILWFLVRKALLSLLPATLVGRILVAWRP